MHDKHANKVTNLDRIILELHHEVVGLKEQLKRVQDEKMDLRAQLFHKCEELYDMNENHQIQLSQLHQEHLNLWESIDKKANEVALIENRLNSIQGNGSLAPLDCLIPLH
ncbi:hypothetical protein MJO28_001326 [Puccinia striiformis f. sp. tritici]|uniref:Uncharacterized protein n=1 Tax=Puccinia striiformis f. sp. tritici TaxID=168172 RepID=A0ACC0EU06_9BASI|nr:hypothetical protein MJO28_001326 [Puccinia striiformis f. sp. tritici]KAI7965586.1 hypothetical protein MJO29_001334 [Puccinia striiformis f. sp. tritici]